MKARLLAVVLFALVVSPFVCGAQEARTTDTGKAEGVNIDLSVPESPGFVILGLSPQTVVRPSNTQELAAALLSGIDKNGNFQTGLALDTTPYSLLFGDGVDLAHYQKNAGGFNMTRVLWRLQTSLATTKGASDSDKSVRLGVGIRLTPWDLGDPRLDSSRLNPGRPGLVDCLKDVARREALSTPLLPLEEVSEADRPQLALQHKEVEDRLKAGSQSCRDEAQKRLWNNSSFSLGAAPSWISEDGSIDKMTWNGGGVWASFAYGFEDVKGLEDRAQLILHARYRAGEQVPDPKNEGAFLEQNSTIVGGRLRIGTDRLAFALEGAWIHEDPRNRRTSDSGRFSIDCDIRLTRELWLEVSVGGESGRRDGNDQVFVLGTLKWGTTTQPTNAKSLPR